VKVPYLTKKRAAEHRLFIKEISSSLAKAIRRQRSNKDEDVNFRHLYPLFCLLRSFSESQFLPDPSKEFALSSFRQKGERELFLKAIGARWPEATMNAAVRDGVRQSTFSEFFLELFSDCLLVLVQGVTLNYRGAVIALRCALEDLYRHLYYKDHPEELRMIKSGTADELTLGLVPAAFRTYLQRVTYLAIFRNVDDGFNVAVPTTPAPVPGASLSTLFAVNEKLYAETSSAVHGALGVWLSGFQTPASFTPDEKRDAQLHRHIRDFVDVAISFLIAAHYDRFVAFDDYTKSIVLSHFPAAKRQRFRKLMNV
jgi:hypothetical protein